MNRKRPPTGTENGNAKRTRLNQASSANRSQTTVHGAGRSTTRFGNHASPGVRIPVGRNDAAVYRETDPHRRDSDSYLSDRYQSAATSHERQQPFNSSGSEMATRAILGLTPTLRGYTGPIWNHYEEARRREHENRDSWSGLHAAGPYVRIPVGTAQTGRNYSDMQHWRDTDGSYLSDEDEENQISDATSNEGTRGYGIAATIARSGTTLRDNEAWIDSQREYVEARRREETNRGGNWFGPYYDAGPGVRSPAGTVGSVEDGRNYSGAARSHGINYSQDFRDSGAYMREYQGGATSRERQEPFIGNGIETRARPAIMPTPRNYTMPTWNHHGQARRREETDREVSTTHYSDRIRVEASGYEAGRNPYVLNGSFNLPNESYAVSMQEPRGSRRHEQLVVYEPEPPPPPPTNGLTDIEIRRLPSRLFVTDGSSGGNTSKTTCLICLADYKSLDSLRILGSCVHVFHSECVDTWLRSKASCPNCRTTVTVPTV